MQVLRSGITGSHRYKLIVFALILMTTSCGDDESLQGGKAESKPATASVSGQSASTYSASVLPEKMTVEEKKQRFVSLVAPAMDEVHAELMKQYEDVSRLVRDGSDEAFVGRLKKEYRTESDEELLMALKPHPQSIGLAQAAMESAWGTSRFFREANNIFGVWSFDETEPRIAAGKKRGNKTIWVKKYPSIKASIKDYYRVLARGNAFVDFRNLKMVTNDPYKLVKKLNRYSEKGDLYGKELAAMIRSNKFDVYDN